MIRASVVSGRYRFGISVSTIALLIASCSSSPTRDTLAELHTMEPDLADVEHQDSLDKAVESYRRYLDETPTGIMTPEAMRRLADLQIEKHYGVIGDAEIIEMAAPEPSSALMTAINERREEVAIQEGVADMSESDEEFERRTTGAFEFSEDAAGPVADLPGGPLDPELSGPAEAIEIYKRILTEYPNYERNDQVLYQLARAYDEVGRTEEAMAVMERLVAEHPYSRHLDEVLFRRGEYFFTRRRFRDAEDTYAGIIAMGPSSSYYELALYKLGWSLYKQEFYEEALHNYIALLDYKLSMGYDFDQAAEAEDEERRVSDTFRVVSLSFSNLGGPEVLEEYFSEFGNRNYEDRIYSNLGEFYLSKLRYADAANSYELFVELYPFHARAPHFSMRVTEIYTDGDFPLLVVESKRDFATKYGLQAEYWNYFDVNESPDVLSFLKTNLKDLANYYHALYQEETLVDERPDNYREASQWYREFLMSFPEDEESPAINYQLADLMLENEDFGDAASEYERTAYDYAVHEQAAAAAYAAIYARRQHLEQVDEYGLEQAKLATIASSLRFAESFPQHEQVPIVLGAAAEDIYALENFELARVAAQRLIDRYPDAELPLRHSAWTIVAHSSFDLEDYTQAELAYGEVLALTPDEDEAYQGYVDNLAASIYRQGELANETEDYRAAADHFLRVKEAAPTSGIRSSAEYDAAAALVRLEDWLGAADVFEAFRDTYPDHELAEETTRQLAFVYRQGGELDQSAVEYLRMADETDDPEIRREAMLEAGELYEQADSITSALEVYARYVDEFPMPLDIAQETRFKMAEMYEDRGDAVAYLARLEEIVAVDREAGALRTDRSRFLAAQSALVLTERLVDDFEAVALVQPLEANLARKQELMGTAMAALEDLVNYQVGDVTAAATFYIAEVYYDFSQSLLDSERPADLSAAELVDYDLALEEEAFPFEEQAITVHEANFELLATGVYNGWIEKSLQKLAFLMPGRYAKAEISSGYIPSIDTYAYRAPNAPLLDENGEIASEAGAADTPAGLDDEPEQAAIGSDDAAPDATFAGGLSE